MKLFAAMCAICWIGVATGLVWLGVLLVHLTPVRLTALIMDILFLAGCFLLACLIAWLGETKGPKR